MTVTCIHGLFQVLETYMFHSFLKARLSRRLDAFAQMDLSTQSEEDRYPRQRVLGARLWGDPGAHVAWFVWTDKR